MRSAASPVPDPGAEVAGIATAETDFAAAVPAAFCGCRIGCREAGLGRVVACGLGFGFGFGLSVGEDTVTDGLDEGGDPLDDPVREDVLDDDEEEDEDDEGELWLGVAAGIVTGDFFVLTTLTMGAGFGCTTGAGSGFGAVARPAGTQTIAPRTAAATRPARPKVMRNAPQRTPPHPPRFYSTNSSSNPPALRNGQTLTIALYGGSPRAIGHERGRRIGERHGRGVCDPGSAATPLRRR